MRSNNSRIRRREFLKRGSAAAGGLLLTPLAHAVKIGVPFGRSRVTILDFGAVGDGRTISTKEIQRGIDAVAAQGGGVLTIPKGTFLTGALFLKPGVNLNLASGAVLKGSTNVADYPMRKTRIEGHFENWLPALINADKCDGLQISGSGTLDGSGEPFWDAFWKKYDADKSTKNLDVPRPRLALIQNSTGVKVQGVTFKDAGFWNLHLYRCSDVEVENVRFEVPDGVRCPSTDGTDIDSCQNVTIRGCTYRVDDDAIAIKGSKGPLALDDKDSPAVEKIRVDKCIFQRGHGVVTLGSEATTVRDVVVSKCRIEGKVAVVRLKLRPDTPQRYEDIHFRDIELIGNGNGLKAEIFDIRPWKQYFDLQGQPAPKSVVSNVTLSNVKGSFGSFGAIQGNPGQTELSGIAMDNIDIQLKDERLEIGDGVKVEARKVRVNGSEWTAGKA